VVFHAPACALTSACILIHSTQWSLPHTQTHILCMRASLKKYDHCRPLALSACWQVTGCNAPFDTLTTGCKLHAVTAKTTLLPVICNASLPTAMLLMRYSLYCDAGSRSRR
jgi:hypothetical protein